MDHPKWSLSNVPRNHLRSSKTPFSLINGSLHYFKTSTFYSSRAVNTEKAEEILTCETVTKISRRGREAQAALLEYLHGTRALPFTEAEYISKNSPNFLEKLLKKVENEEETGKSLTRLFRYHPINEFEPFLESLGLKPSEFSPLLPRHLMFLSDDDMLLENYHVLCNYGIARSKIGKIYKEATEIFKYDFGVLSLKFRAYENLGLSRSRVIKFVVLSPSLLVGDVNRIFTQVLEELKSLGLGYDWILGCLSEKNSYNWSQILETLRFFGEMDYSKEELGGLIKKHPGLLFDSSGKKVCSLIGLLLKLGSNISEISSLFLQIPRVQIGTFVKNFRQSLLFLLAIDMEADDIGTILREHPLVLGSCFLKKPTSVLSGLNIGKKRLCGIIKEDPNLLKCWALGSKIQPLPNSGEDQRSLMQKTEFLLNLGFVEGSDEMRKAFKVFRGKGGELQERFDCFVKAGLDPKVVSKMIKGAPHVLNMSKDVIKEKIDFLVNELQYPISSVVPFPSFISYTTERAKLRFSMYNWLKDEGKVSSKLALSTILACSDKAFIKQYVEPHAGGLEVWEKLKKALSSS
ncbi:Mitochodrial transcription termination factor-related [Macleaya cordata]|uniref:Mitochodrial transcription termination factor-related n=1 Tax=Macleaya cordata TaxID=56857 RepID=A0A200Q841_MACCD|nr:Mitochodrial transcription termination factor-related [Macleaya cordata]